MPLEPCARAGLPRLPRNHARPRRLVVGGAALALALLLPGLTGCAPFDDEAPPNTAAAADGPPPDQVAAGSAANSPGEPGAPLPPGGPIPPDGQGPRGQGPQAPPSGPPGGPPSAAPGAPTGANDDDSKYVSGEYAIGEDTGASTDSYDDTDPSALTDFRQPLAPYGSWVDDPTYGTVWVPSASAVGPDFQPYVSGGHWAYDDDYVWVSDYSWGWAPFHYGRWVSITGRGWSWIPGREYRGAWVAWSVDDGYSYLGWAPLGPSFVWFGGAAVGWGGYWGPRWSYCPRGEVFAPRVGAHVVVGPGAIAIAGRMRPYGAVNARIAGPPPARLGYAASAVPHTAASVSVSRAQQFARPSTARALGASPPVRASAGAGANVRVGAGAPVRAGESPVVNGARPPLMSGARVAPGASSPGAQNGARYQSAPARAPTYSAPARAPTYSPAPARGPSYAPAPGAYHGGSSFHGGGGGHMGGGHR